MIMIDFDSSETPEEFWYNNLAKYREREISSGFPENLCVSTLMKMRHKEVAVYKGYLKNGDHIIITYPTFNRIIKNFIAIGIHERELSAETNVEVYELDYNLPMTDDFVLSLLSDSHGWDIQEYGDLSSY